MALTIEDIKRIRADKYPAGRFHSIAGHRGADARMWELCDMVLSQPSRDDGLEEALETIAGGYTSRFPGAPDPMTAASPLAFQSAMWSWSQKVATEALKGTTAPQATDDPARSSRPSTGPASGLVTRLRDEADLCRNETAVDIANLLDQAADALSSARE